MGGVDRDALNAAFARHVGAKLGPQAAYAPAERCPQGHLNVDEDDEPCAVGALCHRCELDYWWPSVGVTLEDRFREARNHAHDPHWHPEWRIGPGEPKDFCGSLDLTIPTLHALGLGWDGSSSMVRVWVSPWRPGMAEWAMTGGNSSDVTDYATALVRAALRVLGEVSVHGGVASDPGGAAGHDGRD